MEEKLIEARKILKPNFNISRILRSIDLDDAYESMNNKLRSIINSKISFMEKNLKDLQTLCLYYGIVLKSDDINKGVYEKYRLRLIELIEMFKIVIFIVKSKRTSEEEMEYIFDCLNSKNLIELGITFESFFDSEETIDFVSKGKFYGVDYYISINNFINAFENLSRGESRERLMKFCNFVIEHKDEIENDQSMIFFDFDEDDDRSVSSEVTEEG